MIFLRQKHFNNSLINSANHRSARSNPNTRRHHNRNNRNHRNTQTRPNQQQTPQPQPQQALHCMPQNTSGSNTSSLANSNSNLNTSHNRNSLNTSLNSIEFIRSITINERLASIGGLFGALSIIITGALLYAIFTAKTEDKWYYIIAVLINVSLLIILMIGAIIFDKVYLKKFSNNTRRLHQSLTSPSRHTSRIIHVNPTLCQNNYVSHHSIINELNNRSSSQNYLNDVPPSYDTSISANINKQNRNINSISNQISSENENRADVLIPSSIYVTVTNLNQVKRDNYDLDLDQNGKFLPPPNYFDLYPLKDTDRNIILEHNLILHSSTAAANNISDSSTRPSQNRNENSDNSSNSRCIHIDSVERN